MAAQVVDDGKGYVWVAAEMSPGGLAIELFKSVPFGKRALFCAQACDLAGEMQGLETLQTCIGQLPSKSSDQISDLPDKSQQALVLTRSRFLGGMRQSTFQ